MSKKRDRLEIIHDVLEAIRFKRDKAKPTHILYKSNLSHQMLIEYLTELLKKEFVVEKTDRKGKRTYALTDKGHGYLNDYDRIRSFVDSYGLN